MTAYKSIISLGIGKLAIYLVLFMLQISAALGQDKKARLELDFREEKGKKYIIAKANDFTHDSIGAPIEEIDLYIYVERMFSLLPIGDRFNETDENGELTIEFPTDLPGDTTGRVNVIVKIEDADEYADTSFSKTINWGIPLVIDKSENKRALWAASANAPISLLILTNSLILIVWGIIFYICLKIYHISKI
jgi:hypothetical protein